MQIPQLGSAFYTRSLFRAYDEDEVPDDLNERIVKWVNMLGIAMEIESPGGNTIIQPKKD